MSQRDSLRPRVLRDGGGGQERCHCRKQGKGPPTRRGLTFTTPRETIFHITQGERKKE